MRSKWFAMMLAISLLLTGCTGGGDPSSAADDGGSSQAAARTETEWGSTDAVLHTYDGEVQAATFCLTGDGERFPALEAGEFGTGFLEGLGVLTPQTPPEAVDWTQTGVSSPSPMTARTMSTRCCWTADSAPSRTGRLTGWERISRRSRSSGECPGLLRRQSPGWSALSLPGPRTSLTPGAQSLPDRLRCRRAAP